MQYRTEHSSFLLSQFKKCIKTFLCGARWQYEGVEIVGFFKAEYIAEAFKG